MQFSGKKIRYPLVTAGFGILIAAALAGCRFETPSDTFELSHSWNPVNNWKAPMYWTVYEYNYDREIQTNGKGDNWMPEDLWLKNIEWVEENLLPYGINMICIDGWGSGVFNERGYRTKHDQRWKYTYGDWSKDLRKRGMKLGIYDNPLWVHPGDVAADAKVEGTDYYIRDVAEKDWSLWFKWVDVTRPGAEEYVKGYVKHYGKMGVDYLRVDFLSWYETGTDSGYGVVGRTDRPRAHYETALRWMREECDRWGIFLSLVMPNLRNDAELEAKYGHMFRINADAGPGTWHQFSDDQRNNPTRSPIGEEQWSYYRNAFDGFIYWSRLTGPQKVILDGDFIRLRKLASDDERRSVMSLNIIAGGPVSIADEYNTVGNSLRFYQNKELMDLVQERFTGKPLSPDPGNGNDSQVWRGQTAGGDWIVAFFNREGSAQTRTLSFSADLGITVDGANPVTVREIWGQDAPAGSTVTAVSGSITGDSFSVNNLPSHACRVYRLTR